jgi:hypothetical protein
MILRYLARLTSTEPAAKTRKFIIQYFLEDDTLRILEPPQRNSGHKVRESRCNNGFQSIL